MLHPKSREYPAEHQRTAPQPMYGVRADSMRLTVSEAARRASVSRNTIYNHIKTGTLSVIRDADGTTFIDPIQFSHLFDGVDVWEGLNLSLWEEAGASTWQETAPPTEGAATQASDPAEVGENQILQVKLDHAEDRVRRLEIENEHLRELLAGALENSRRLRSLIEQRLQPVPDAELAFSRKLANEMKVENKRLRELLASAIEGSRHLREIIEQQARLHPAEFVATSALPREPAPLETQQTRDDRS